MRIKTITIWLLSLLLLSTKNLELMAANKYKFKQN